MKKYLKEIIILAIQLGMFYLFPLTAGPSDMMGLVVILLFATLLLSAVITCISDNIIKYLYPLAISVLFIPSVFIYYNESALIHSLWYFTAAAAGTGIGTIIYILRKKIAR